MSNLFKNQNNRFSPPSTSNNEECTETDANAFYCLPAGGGGRTEDRPQSSWWEDVQTWHAALWRAAVLRSALSAACNNGGGVGANCSDADAEQTNSRSTEKSGAFLHSPLVSNTKSLIRSPEKSIVDGPEKHPSTLLLLSARENESGVDADLHQDVFLCTVPAKLVNGQRIRLAIGDSTFDLTINAAKAITCQTPNSPIEKVDTRPSYALPINQNEICNEWERRDASPRQRSAVATLVDTKEIDSSFLPKFPRNQSTTEAIPYRGFMPRQLHSHRSWPPPATTNDAAPKSSYYTTKTLANSFYNRKRAKSMQLSSNIRQRKREISIARVIPLMPERPVKNDCDTDFSEEMISAAGNTRKDMPSTVDGVNLEEIKRFAKLFKMKRLSLGLTQTQVGQTLSLTNGPAYSQSAICRFEKLDITPKSAQKIKPVLERWLHEVDDQIKINGGIVNIQRTFLSPPPPPPPSAHADAKPSPNRDNFLSSPNPNQHHPHNRSETSSPEKSIDIGGEIAPSPEPISTPIDANNCSDNVANNCKRRKRRTSFTPQALEVLNDYFERNSHPSGVEMTTMAERLNYEREVIRVWFCNKRQALKNTFKKLKTSP